MTGDETPSFIVRLCLLLFVLAALWFMVYHVAMWLYHIIIWIGGLMYGTCV